MSSPDKFYKLINTKDKTWEDPFLVNGFIGWTDKKALINAIIEGVYGDNVESLSILTVECDVTHIENVTIDG